MGANTFSVTVKGKSARDAFDTAVGNARYESGSGGYSGTIAEKDSFVMIPRDSVMSEEEQMNHLINTGDRRVDDKWGPAGCFDLGSGEYMFFGWASS